MDGDRMYQAVYKCRLCGETKAENRDLKSKEAAVIRLGMTPKNPMHDCEDGSVGLMELQ
jgi:hypothetical protein